MTPVKFVPLQTRKISPDGIRLSIYVRGTIYELPEDELHRLFPAGGYELVKVAGPQDTKAGGVGDAQIGSDLGDTATGSDAPTSPAVAPVSSRRSKWLSRKGGT